MLRHLFKISKEHRWLFVLLIVSIIAHWTWFSFEVFSYSDWAFTFKETLLDYRYPSVWKATQTLGGIDSALWRLPLHFMYGLFALFNFSYSVAEKVLVFWPTVILGPISSYLLMRLIVKNNFAAAVGATTYSFNTYFLAINTQGHVLLTLAFHCTVLAMFFFFRGYQRGRLHDMIWSSLFLTISGFLDFRAAYISLLIFALFVLYELIVDLYKKKTIKRLILILAPVVGLFILLNSFWLIIYATTGNLGAEVLGRPLFGDRFWNLNSAITLFHPFWTGGEPSWFIAQKIPFYFWLVPVLAFAGLIVARKNKLIVFFGIVAAFGILLTKQVDAPFGNLYPWLYDNLPGFNAFREATKFYFLIALGYSVLITSLIGWLQVRKKEYKVYVVASIVITALVLVLFSWNIKPLITGEIATLHVEREIPKDYRILKDFLLSQPEHGRTLWVPKQSHWGFYSADKPSHGAVSNMGGGWRDFLSVNEQDTPAKAQAHLFTGPLGEKLISSASVKYVIIPPEEKQITKDFFSHYGEPRQYYIDLLDSLDYLDKIDIGTEELVVYENKTFKPYVNIASEVISVKNNADAYSVSNYLSDKNMKDVPLEIGTEAMSSITIRPLFTAYQSAAYNQSQRLWIQDEEDSVEKEVDFHKNLAQKTLQYQADNASISFLTKPLENIRLNNEIIDFDETPDSQLLADIDIKGVESLYLQLDDKVIPVQRTSSWQNLGDTQNYESIKVLEGYDNLIENYSFERNLWNTATGDCHNYDNNPIINQGINSENATHGSNSLELSAQRHVACTSTEVVIPHGDYLFSFDYMSPNAKLAGYTIDFLDYELEDISSRLTIPTIEQWRSLNRPFSVGSDQVRARIYLYAYETNEMDLNKVLYDSVELTPLKTLEKIAVPKTSDFYQTVSDTMKANVNIVEYSSSDHDGQNIIPNFSFEQGLWEEKVGDCHNYDSNPVIGMNLSSEASDGNNALKLRATRHRACTKISFDVSKWGSHLLQLDYKILSGKYAGYYIQFNDTQKTVVSNQTEKHSQNEWDTISEKIIVPDGATSATLYLYAYETEREDAVVLYDNLRMLHVPDLENTFYYSYRLKPKDSLKLPGKVEFTEVNATKKNITIKDATNPFVLSFSESFHPGWKLYLRSVANQTGCEPLKRFKAKKDRGIGEVLECENKQRSAAVKGLSYLKKDYIFDDQHIELNGYANGWIIDPEFIKANYGPEYYKENPDGSIDFNMVIYFKPQSYFYVGLMVSGITLTGIVGYLGYSWYKQRTPRSKDLG